MMFNQFKVASNQLISSKQQVYFLLSQFSIPFIEKSKYLLFLFVLNKNYQFFDKQLIEKNVIGGQIEQNAIEGHNKQLRSDLANIIWLIFN